MPDWTSLILLLGAHHVADASQPSWLIQNKKRHLFAHLEHAAAWATIVSAGLLYFGIFEPWKFFFLLVSHGLTDVFFYIVLPRLLKCEKRYEWVYIDQALHYAQILIVALL